MYHSLDLNRATFIAKRILISIHLISKRDHKLEETQAEIEYQLRVIVSKQGKFRIEMPFVSNFTVLPYLNVVDAQKDEVDKSQERELLSRLMEVIDERNDIIENMILEENKYATFVL